MRGRETLAWGASSNEPEGAVAGVAGRRKKTAGGVAKRAGGCSRLRCANHPKVIAEKNAVKSESDVAKRILLDIGDERREQNVSPLQLKGQSAVRMCRRHRADRVR